MITSKSPRRVTLLAYHLAKEALPDYTSKFSRRDYTQPQLFACLVLKEFERKDYRGAEQLLRDWPALARELDLWQGPPDHTTLKRAADRLLVLRRAQRLLDEVVRFARLCKLLGRRHVALAAMDASGFESRHVSAYFVRRRSKGGIARGEGKTQETTYRRFPKLGILVDTRSHLILSFATGTGPSPDHPHFEKLLLEAWRRTPGWIKKLACDAGYDSERNHRVAREEVGTRTLIPALIGRPTGKPPTGRWRRLMSRALRTKRGRRRSGYTQRWQSETGFSMMKRNQGSALRARSAPTQKRELALRVLAHDLAVV